MVTVKLYVEGAAQKTDLERTRCREAFSAFFATAGLDRRPRVVPCGGRRFAYDAFVTAVRSARPGELPLLLVDAEAEVAAHHTTWQHLKARDHWDKPDGATDDQAFLMVQVMETWFLADRAMLRAYFGPEFAEKHIQAWPSLEDVPKPTVYDVLEKATANCRRKAYAKGRTSFEMLARLDPVKVEGACLHAKTFLDRLRKL
jgi:hypothetical protein